MLGTTLDGDLGALPVLTGPGGAGDGVGPV